MSSTPLNVVEDAAVAGVDAEVISARVPSQYDAVIVSVKNTGTAPLSGFVLQVTENTDFFDYVDYLRDADFCDELNAAQRWWTSENPPHTLSQGQTSIMIVRTHSFDFVKILASCNASTTLTVQISGVQAGGNS